MIEQRIEEYEQFGLIKNYNGLLLKKELLLCEYTYLLNEYNSDNHKTTNIKTRKKSR